MISVAELLLSPVGLAAITTLASRRKVSTMMGIFFVSLGIGGFLSGKLAYLTAINPQALLDIGIKSALYANIQLLAYYSDYRNPCMCCIEYNYQKTTVTIQQLVQCFSIWFDI